LDQLRARAHYRAPISARTPPTADTPLTASRPPLNLRTQPKHRAPAAEVDDRAGHVLVAGLVLADRVAMGQAEDLRHIAGVDQFID
jgi:hypothetical protein